MEAQERVLRATAVGALLCCCLVPRVSAQQVAYAAGLNPELDSTTQAAVTREFAHARERNLPLEPLVAKVREGVLKSAKGGQIRVAVARLAVRLDSARAALGSNSTLDELVAGAEALSAGAGAASLRELRAAAPGHAIAAPLGTLAQLVLSGVQPRRAVDMIVELLRRNATTTQLATLGNLVEGDVASGLRPDESASIRMRGIEGSLGFPNGDKVSVTTAAPAGPPLQTGTPPNSHATPKRKP